MSTPQVLIPAVSSAVHQESMALPGSWEPSSSPIVAIPSSRKYPLLPPSVQAGKALAVSGGMSVSNGKTRQSQAVNQPSPTRSNRHPRPSLARTPRNISPTPSSISSASRAYNESPLSIMGEDPLPGVHTYRRTISGNIIQVFFEGDSDPEDLDVRPGFGWHVNQVLDAYGYDLAAWMQIRNGLRESRHKADFLAKVCIRGLPRKEAEYIWECHCRDTVSTASG